MNGLPSVRSNGSKDDEISPLELESLAAEGDVKKTTTKKGFLTPAGVPMDKLMLLIRLYFELYPRLMFGACAVTAGLILWAWSPWQSWGALKSPRNHMVRDYTELTDNFNFQAAHIDHWCLFGGDDRCYCEDPTEATPRTEVTGWAGAHQRNRRLVNRALGRGAVDVVFLGDQVVQSWDGNWLDKPCPEGRKIAKLFNETFVDDSPQTDFKAVALGIYGDRLNNILWRIQHGETPNTLNPKVFWLVMGTNDLALGMCSEEVVTLGIMRIAEEIHHVFPDAIVVIQGILPRSNHRDGSLTGKDGDKPRKTKFLHREKNDLPFLTGGTDMDNYMPIMVPGGGRKLERNQVEIDNSIATEKNSMLPGTERRSLQDLTTPNVPRVPPDLLAPKGRGSLKNLGTANKYGRFKDVTAGAGGEGDADGLEEKRGPQPYFDYYLWPSIQAINKELEGFSAKHEHIVYFDASQLVLGSIGNAHYRTAQLSIIQELMPNYVHLSFLGHQVLLKAINEELKRIIFDDDEANDIEKKEGGRQ